MEYVSVKNFDKLQHYSIKGPLWIKLYTSILDDYELSLLPEQSRLVYVLLLPLAALLGNKISTDRRWLAERLHLPELRRESIEVLLKAKFLVPYGTQTESEEPAEETEEVEQLREVLVTSLLPAAPAGKQKKTKKKVVVDVAAILADPLFQRFWEAYPRKDARLRAAKDWGKLVQEGIITEATLPLMLATISHNLASGIWRLSERNFIPLPSSWLNEQRWEDQGGAYTQGNSPDAPKERPPLKLAL